MTAVQDVLVPDIGDFKEVEIIEVGIAPGQQVNAEDPLITLESDKATMEVPSPCSGTIVEVNVAVGDKVSEGTLVCTMEVGDISVPAPPSPTGMQESDIEPCQPAPLPQLPPETATPLPSPRPAAAPAGAGVPADSVDEAAFSRAHASPAVRRFARELGADLGRIQGTGRKGRITKSDVQAYVKGILTQPRAETPGTAVVAHAGAVTVSDWPSLDFSSFGDTEVKPLSKIKRLTGSGLHRNWVMIPHVTHHEDADITELEAFRKEMNEEAKKQGFRLTMVSFLMKAAVSALRQFPDFNASLGEGGETLVLKKYFHIGIAVDTPEGLVVPVIRDVDQKGVFELARELGDISEKARARKLGPNDMAGGCFTISSLGGIGGVGFTPIVNAPEVAILGVTRARMQPVYRDGQFIPRLMLPLSLSYDHRVIDGAAAARFAAHLAFVLGDVRRLML